MKDQWKAYLALSAMCFFWGTTYLGIRVGVEHVPPFLFSGIRQLVAGGLLCLFFFLKGHKLPEWNELKYHITAGLLMIGVGNGLVSWGELHVSSGVTALICSMMPIWVILFTVFFMKNTERVNGVTVAGVLLGFSGLVVIFKDGLAAFANLEYLGSMLAILVATISWASGMLFIKKQTFRSPPVFSAGIQLTSGGLIMLAVSPFMDSYDHVSFNSEAVSSLTYLIFLGSMLSFSAFAYALKHLPATTVSMHGYINPLVALVAGWAILNERLTPTVILAGLLTIGGVYLVTTGRQMQSRQMKTRRGNAV